MHFHFCPQEVMLIMMLLDSVKVYLYHYKHILLSFFTKMKDEECDVCKEDTE